MPKIKVETGDWYEAEADKKQSHEGIQKMHEAIRLEEEEIAKRGSSLPADWRNRILKKEE